MPACGWRASTRSEAVRNAPARCCGDLQPAIDQGQAGASTVALVHLALGDEERALSWLKTGCERRALGPAQYPPFDPLRRDPRFAAIVSCMGVLW